MAKRFKMGKKSNRRNFSRGTRTHKRNINSGSPMRGGIRL